MMKKPDYLVTIHGHNGLPGVGVAEKRGKVTYSIAQKIRFGELWKRGCYFAAMAKDLLVNWEKKSGERKKIYKQFIGRANKNTVLKQLPDLHQEAFDRIDCLTCANCCKNYSPRFKTPDVKRISRHLRLKESVFIETYLKVDEDGDYVARTAPCPFLGSDNYCTIYEDRPSDCHRFPYTDEDVFIKRPALTLKNATFCPITYHVLERLIEHDRQG